MLAAAQRVIDLRALEMAQMALTKITTHEAVCAERWKNVTDKLDGLATIAKSMGFSTLGLLVASLAYFLVRFGLPGLPPH